MEVEHKMVSIEIDENHQARLQELEREGYSLIAGVPPVAVYHLVRQKPQPGQAPPPTGGMGTLSIDEAGVFVRKAGESDGSV